MPSSDLIPVLEVGGTHVSAALVSPSDWSVSSTVRRAVDASERAGKIIDAWVSVARSLGADYGARWGVAIPDPFDYPRGVAMFDASVAKFGALHGVDVGESLGLALDTRLTFLNDADAFALGEWTLGPRTSRLMALTLGTGVGSGWLVDGEPADPGLPAGGRIHTMTVGGRPLEDVFSRRALRAAFAAAGGDPSLDVREICDLAREGDERAVLVLRRAITGLAAVVEPAAHRFGAEELVIGGSMAGSWDLLGPWFAASAGDLPPVRVSSDAQRAGFVGAAVCASRTPA